MKGVHAYNTYMATATGLVETAFEGALYCCRWSPRYVFAVVGRRLEDLSQRNGQRNIRMDMRMEGWFKNEHRARLLVKERFEHLTLAVIVSLDCIVIWGSVVAFFI